MEDKDTMMQTEAADRDVSVDPRSLSNHERYHQFGRELDQLHRETLAKIGKEDAEFVKRLDRFSRRMEILGRVLIFVSPEPVTFLAGVTALWVHKQLEAIEIGHAALHSAYDGLEGCERL